MASDKVKEAVKKYFNKNKNKKKYQEEGTLDLRIERGIALEKGNKKEANRLLELIAERKQDYLDEKELVGTVDDLYNEVIIPGITNKLNPAKREKVISLLNENRKKEGLPALVQSPHKETGQRKLLSKSEADKKITTGKKLDTIGHRLGGATDFLSDKFSAVDLQFIKENPELGIRGIDERYPGRPKNIVHVDLLGQKLDPIEKSYLDYVGYPKDIMSRKEGGQLLEQYKESGPGSNFRFPTKNYKEEARQALETKTRSFIQPSAPLKQFEIDERNKNRIQLRDLVEQQKKLQGGF